MRLRLGIFLLCLGSLLLSRRAAESQQPALLPSAPTPAPTAVVPVSSLVVVNGRPYRRPTHKDQFRDYVRDSYGWPAFARSTVRTLYEIGVDKPKGWGQDFPGFAQRFGSNVGITAISGNVRYGMESLFREDMRYIPCHACSVKRKIANALLSEITARHDSNGRRFFTLTPAIADFSGPIVANATWYPSHDPFGGVVATRTVAATRVGQHLFTEFVLEPRRYRKAIQGDKPRTNPPTPGPLQPRPRGKTVPNAAPPPAGATPQP